MILTLRVLYWPPPQRWTDEKFQRIPMGTPSYNTKKIKDLYSVTILMPWKH